jgi:hypothetical protein
LLQKRLKIAQGLSAKNIACDVATQSDSSRQVSEGLLPDGSRLHSCLEQLQDIVGPALSRERLVQVVLAADFDVNRALNFIYSSPDPSPSLESDLRRVSD